MAQETQIDQLSDQLNQLLEQRQWAEGIPLVDQLATLDSEKRKEYQLLKALLQNLSSGPVEIPDPPASIRQFQRPTEIKGCESDPDCFRAAAQQCQPSRFTYIQSTNIFGVISTCFHVVEIWGETENQCITLETCPINQVGLSDEMEAMIRQQGDPAFIEELKSYVSDETVEYICRYPGSDNIGKFHTRQGTVGYSPEVAAFGEIMTTEYLLDDEVVANCESVEPAAEPPIMQ
ncbi:MAG: hypothetical protein HC921_04515 [Synechococcaceae cyanobacterium SM2_3_1]|nr:hypothetical protein [Synechococcaceae cyanobacterium SM2_3_1]